MDHERKRDKGWAIACEKEKQRWIHKPEWRCWVGTEIDACTCMGTGGRWSKETRERWKERDRRQWDIGHRAEGDRLWGWRLTLLARGRGPEWIQIGDPTFHSGAPFFPPPLSHNSTQTWVWAAGRGLRELGWGWQCGDRVDLGVVSGSELRGAGLGIRAYSQRCWLVSRGMLLI